MPLLQTWDDLPEQVAGPAVSKRTLPGKAASLVRVTIKAGTAAARHAHRFEQFVQVLAGSGTLETAAGTQRFAAGSLFHFPPEAWHAAQFDTDTVLVETNIGA